MAERPERASKRLRRLASIARREAALARAAVRAYNRVLKAIEPLLRAHDYNPDVLDPNLPAWRDAVDEELVPEVTEAYVAALLEDAREGVTVDAQAYAARYLSTVHNRMVGLSEAAFDPIRTSLRDGSLAGEGIPELAARVDALLTDGQRWRNRGTVVARTEVVGANNAGHYDAAVATAQQLEVSLDAVVKEWLATPGPRTRPTHAAADGQQVLGMTGHFHVGEALMLRPGDVSAPASEVIQCRCSTLYHFPGDLDYPEGLEPEPTPEPEPVQLTATDPEAARAFQSAAQEYAEGLAKGNTLVGKRWHDYQQSGGQWGYSNQNKLLRGDDTTARRNLAKVWDDVFAQLGQDTAEPLSFYRGITGEYATSLLERAEPGAVLEDAGVTSTTASAVMARGWLSDHIDSRDAPADSLVLELRVPEGTRLVGGHTGTFETMLAPGTRIRVLSSDRRPSPGRYPGEVNYVVAEVLP